MKTKLLIFGLLSAILNMSAKLIVNKSTASANSASTVPAVVADPAFTSLAGNLFLAVNVNQEMAVNDGDVVEFVFAKGEKLITFHINDINQELLDKGDANLLVMVHHDLALALKKRPLKQINVVQKGKVTTIPVNQPWQPDLYLGQY